MKVKKLLSTFAALAIAASSFAGLGINASAAEPTVLYEKGTTAENAWTDTDLTDWTGGTTTLTDNGIQITGSNASHGVAYTIAPKANSIITIDAEVYLDSDVGRDFSKGNYSYFKYGNVYVMHNDQSKASAYSLTGHNTAPSTFTATGVTYRGDIPAIGTHKIHMEVNTATNMLTDLTVNDTKLVTDTALENADYTAIGFGYNKGGSVSTTQTEVLKSIKITETEQTITTADYTVKYVNAANEEIKTAATRTSVVGEAVEITEGDKAAVYTDDDKKYVYDEANSTTSATLAETGTELIVKFAEVGKKTFNVTAKAGDVELGTVDESVSNFVGDTSTVPYQKYILKDNTVYYKDATNKEYKASVTVAEEQADVVLDYTKSFEDVVFYSEAENIEGLTADNGGQGDSRCSNAYGAYAEADTTITTLPSGKYVMEFAICGNKTVTFAFKAGDVTVASADTTGSIQVVTSEEFELAEETAIILGAAGSAGSNSKLLDYVLIRRTGDAAPSIASVVTTAPVGMTDPTIPATIKDTNDADVTSSELTEGKTVTTIYVKIANGSDDVKPVITLSNNEVMTVTKATYNGGYFICQYVGDADVTVKSVTYGDAAWSNS